MYARARRRERAARRRRDRASSSVVVAAPLTCQAKTDACVRGSVCAANRKITGSAAAAGSAVAGAGRVWRPDGVTIAARARA